MNHLAGRAQFKPVEKGHESSPPVFPSCVAPLAFDHERRPGANTQRLQVRSSGTEAARRLRRHQEGKGR